MKNRLSCIWIPDLVRDKEMKMEKLYNPTVRDHWIIYLFHFLFPRQIFDPNTALVALINALTHQLTRKTKVIIIRAPPNAAYVYH